MKRVFALTLVASIALVSFGKQPDAVPAADSLGNFNVKSFGAKGDGITDDTAAIQSAIEAALGAGDPAKVVRAAKGNIVIPPGDYVIAKPLQIRSAMYLKFTGSGKSTRLHPSGTLAAVLDINGAAFCTFADFRIEGVGSEQVTDAIYYYWDPPLATRSTGGCVFRDIQIQNTRCVTGFRIGKPKSAAQCDTTLYENINVSGNWSPGESTLWQNGFYVGSDAWGNNLIHTFVHCGATRWMNGFKVTPTNFVLTGGSLGANGTDFNVANLSYFNVTGVRSELSQRLATFNLSTSAPANFSLNDILFDTSGLAPDQVVIQGRFNGCLRINNLSIGSGAASPKVSLDPFNAASLLINGLTSSSTRDGFLGGCSPKVDIVAHGYTQTNRDGSYRASGPRVNPGKGRR